MAVEAVRLADFLRLKCSQNKYGLRYLNPEQTLLLIPWPVVAKANEESPPGFKMFHEWAEVSFARRGNKEGPQQQETPTLQKHRFRNALARANGIAFRRDIKVDGARVYEFVDSRRGPRNSDAVASPYSSEGYTTDVDIGDDPTEMYPIMSPFQDATNGHYNGAYYPEATNYPSAQMAGSHVPGPSSAVPDWSPKLENIEDLVDLHDLIQEDEQQPHTPMQNSPYGASALPTSPAGPSSGLQHLPISTPQRLLPIESISELEIILRFRQEEALRYYVTNKQGCRVYFGKNIPDIANLLEKQNLDSIVSKLRLPPAWYFGPESLQAIQLPIPQDFMKSPTQQHKTEAILANMDRGLMLIIDNGGISERMNIPDVYAIRLCQTRIFPYFEGAINPNQESLKRMESTKVFDGQLFFQQYVRAEQMNGLASYPSPTFLLSLGQRPTCEDRTLLMVGLSITVQRAQQLIQTRLDSDGVEICISGINSVDVEAQNLASRLTETLTLR